MTLQQPSLMTLSRRKAALVRHLGSDHPRTLEAAAILRMALMRQAIREAGEIQPPFTDAEREELSALLLSA